jgi:tagatose 1,6-diphosphate aldolase
VDIPGTTGVLSTLEDHAFEVKDGERYSRPIEGWTVAKIKRAGAAGVKVLVWHRPGLSDAAAEHQDAFVTEVGDACRKHDIPFVLELLVYPEEGEDTDSVAYARAKPKRVIASIEHFSDDAFGVDLLKLEFPCDLKYAAEYASGAFDGVAREPAYDLKEVAAYLSDMHQATNVPWVLLSAGVGPREFFHNLELSFAAGASGFLAGRAVWLDALDAYPDLESVEEEVAFGSVPYLRQISALAETAWPWFEHPRYGGTVVVAGASASWSKDYGA